MVACGGITAATRGLRPADLTATLDPTADLSALPMPTAAVGLTGRVWHTAVALLMGASDADAARHVTCEHAATISRARQLRARIFGAATLAIIKEARCLITALTELATKASITSTHQAILSRCTRAMTMTGRRLAGGVHHADTALLVRAWRTYAEGLVLNDLADRARDPRARIWLTRIHDTLPIALNGPHIT